jgi:glycosyltransferase involved in cell wall biosynthesis
MKLACYGWVDAEAGSVSSANYLLLRELLARGIAIDLYANEDHVPSPAGLSGDRFHYIGVRPQRPYRHLSKRLQHVVNWTLDPILRRAWRGIYGPIVAERGRQIGGYDSLVSLGTPPAFDIADTPTITWLQGPPTAELDAIRRLRPQIVLEEGFAFWRALTWLYWYRVASSRRALASSDRLICGSAWARDLMISEGFSASDVNVLPYPVDLDLFRPAWSRHVDWSRPTILSVGRLDPRKRLDLLIEAFDLLIERHPEAQLKIIGRRGYGRHSLRSMESSRHCKRIEYQERIPRSQVPAAMQNSAVLVQTSENENFGSSVAEALACGVPVVVGIRNGTREYVDAGSRVFESYTPASVASAISEALETQISGADSISRGARAAAEARFSPAAVTDNFLEVIASAKAGRRRRHMRANTSLGAGS